MIYNYEILNPVVPEGSPFYNSNGAFVVPKIPSKYKWYLEAARNNLDTGDRDYFLLLGCTKFDRSCKRIFRDGGKANITIMGEFKAFIDTEIKYRGSVEISYYEPDEDFDAWIVY